MRTLKRKGIAMPRSQPPQPLEATEGAKRKMEEVEIGDAMKLLEN
ncbi:hypothetical protein DsansV1_C10g0099501 [Dioscorea sansibarensis]